MKNTFLTLALLSALAWNTSYAMANPNVVTDDTVINQLNTYSPKTSVVCVKFIRGLGVGSRGSDVSALQAMLSEKGYLSTNPTGYFGTMTKAALIKFQSENGIRGTGYMGELSRGLANKNCVPAAQSPALCSKPPCKPTGIFCTMVARLCDDGAMMPRDASCDWHPEMCNVTSSTATTSPGICTTPECKITKPLPCPQVLCVEGQPCAPCPASTSTKPAICPMMMCAAPPVGCSYIKSNTSECGCGTLSCNVGTSTNPVDPAPVPAITVAPAATSTCSGLASCKPAPVCLACGGLTPAN